MSISVFCLFLAACGGESGVPNDVTGAKVDTSSDGSPSTSTTSTSTASTTSTTSASTTAAKKSSTIVLNTLKAFPTAEGAGAGASGGRGGTVVYVTNTKSSGAGSLGEALTAYGNEPRTIVFSVGGLFTVSDTVYASNIGNVTLAGQTANDLGGVNIVSNQNSSGENGRYYFDHSDNMQIRYVSARGGWEEGTNFGQRKVALNTLSCTNVIYDHYSGGYSSYTVKLRGINADTNKAGNTTIQYSLMHEGINTHNVGSVAGISYASVPQGVDYHKIENLVDVHHNAYILLSHRHTGNIVSGAGGRFARTSNYIYGIGARGDAIAGDVTVDYINNVYEGSDLKMSNLHKFDASDSVKTPNDHAMEPSVYMRGNSVVHDNGTNLIGSNNQWSMWSMYADVNSSLYSSTPLNGLKKDEKVPNVYQRNTQQTKRIYPVTETPTADVKTHVLAHSGSGVRFNIDGSTYNADAIDARYKDIARKKNGPSLDDIGNPNRFTYPDYSVSSSSRNLNTFDSDRDGLPDAWESLHGVTDTNATKVNWTIQGYTIQNNAGYTNLEMYLAELAGDFHMLAKGNN